MTPTYRRAAPADFDQIIFLDGAAFSIDYTPQDVDDVRSLLDLDRFLLAEDDGEVVGVAGDYRFEMTVPGAPTPIPVPGVTWVSVRATHRRRGILSTLMHRQLADFAATGQLAAILTASEGGIYGRFGYGPATRQRAVAIDARAARFADQAGPSGVRLVTADVARARFPAIHDRWRATVPGAISRSQAWWDFLLLDRESQRDSMTALRFLLHPEGYASYRIRVDWNAGRPRHTCVVTDYAAATPQAHRALWQVLLGTDLVATIETAQLPLEDPLAHLLTDARQVTTQSQRDGLWLRPIDVAGLLAARRYGIEVDAVIEVTDPLFGDRRVRLEGGPDGAECTPTDALPDLVLSADQLGSIYLGGYRLRTIAAAGLVVAEDSVLTRLDRAFLAEREPFHGTNF